MDDIFSTMLAKTTGNFFRTVWILFPVVITLLITVVTLVKLFPSVRKNLLPSEMFFFGFIGCFFGYLTALTPNILIAQILTTSVAVISFLAISMYRRQSLVGDQDYSKIKSIYLLGCICIAFFILTAEFMVKSSILVQSIKTAKQAAQGI